MDGLPTKGNNEVKEKKDDAKNCTDTVDFFLCIILLAPTADCYAAKATAPRPHIKKIQTALNQEGYKLKVDGVMGKNTKNALIKHQKVHKLPATGKGDEATLKQLGIK